MIIERKMCFVFSLHCLSETFLILRKIKRHVIIAVHRSSCKVSVILTIFNEL